GAYEVLVGTNAVRNLIRENQIAQIYSMMQTGSRYGMVTMEEAITNLLEGGIVDKEEARRALLKTSDQNEDERDTDYASAAMGGGRIAEGGTAVDTTPADGGKGTGEGYSF